MSKSPSIFPKGSDPVPVSEIPPPAKSKMERQAEKMHARLMAQHAPLRHAANKRRSGQK